MNIKLSIILTIALLLTLSVLHPLPAKAADIYAAFTLAATYQSVDDLEHSSGALTPTIYKREDLGFGLGFAVGHDYKEKMPARLEIEYMFRQDFKYDANPIYTNATPVASLTSELENHTLFLNGYYDFHNKSPFVPYLGGGIGLSVSTVDGDVLIQSSGQQININETATEFAWSVCAGILYKYSNGYEIDAGYRYIDFGELDWGSATGLMADSYTTHEVFGRFRINFE